MINAYNADYIDRWRDEQGWYCKTRVCAWCGWDRYFGPAPHGSHRFDGKWLICKMKGMFKVEGEVVEMNLKGGVA